MKGATVRQLQDHPADLARLLNELDASERAGAKPNADRSFTYRVPAVRLTVQGEHGPVAFDVPTRWLSRQRISFLIDRYVYDHTRCAIRLVSEFKHEQLIQGQISGCRLVPGTSNVHVAEMTFAAPVDVGMFQFEAARVEALVIDGDALQRKLIAARLGEAHVVVTLADSGKVALEKARTQSFDFVLLEIELPDMTGAAVLDELRKQGFIRPVVAMSALPGEQVRTQCIETGFTEVIRKPLKFDEVRALARSLVRPPLVSSLVQDPDMMSLIDQFVRSLTEQISQIEQAFRDKDSARLEAQIRLLKAQGSGFGFEAISETAARVEEQVRTQSELTTLREALNELIFLCAAARPATCIVESSTAKAPVKAGK